MPQGIIMSQVKRGFERQRPVSGGGCVPFCAVCIAVAVLGNTNGKKGTQDTLVFGKLQLGDVIYCPNSKCTAKIRIDWEY